MYCSKITIIPFYGGGKGQSLQITESNDGQVTTTIIKTPDNAVTQHITTTTEVEYPPLPLKQDIIEEFEDNVGRQLDGEDEDNNGELEHESREGLSAWFSRKKQNKEKKDKKDEKKKKEEEERKQKEEEERKKQEEAENKRKEEEKNKEKEKEEIKEEESEDDDSVAINLPPDDAAVAEAKPVGLAIAGRSALECHELLFFNI